jgi:acyl carrier protein
MTTFGKLKEIILCTFDFVGVDAVTPEAALNEDLTLDSLDYVELEMALEEAFNIEIPTGASDDWNTVADVEAFVKAAVADRQLSGEEIV